jgi:hypothetical protein
MKDRKELLQGILKVIQDARMPVSVEYVAANLGLNWATTRTLLLELSLGGYLRATKTTKSWIFTLNEPPEAPNKGEAAPNECRRQPLVR